jgi:uncharacterized protein YndB with AHSA1/START domain
VGESTTTRVINASRAKVYRAITNLAKLLEGR